MACLQLRKQDNILLLLCIYKTHQLHMLNILPIQYIHRSTVNKFIVDLNSDAE